MSRWSAGWRTRKYASRANERLVDVRDNCDSVRICSISGLGIGPDVTIVVRLDEPYD